MDPNIIAYIVIALVAFISTANQILTFVERVHKYVKAVNERKKLKLSQSSRKPSQKIKPAPKPLDLPGKLIQGSYRAGIRIPPNKNFDVDVTVAYPTARPFKKFSFRAI